MSYYTKRNNVLLSMTLNPVQSNQLKHSSSPYLLQHADNPVHWQEWNKATLQSAAGLNKPILLSIGYAACHWCHVMAHESFEDQVTAELMNELFINIWLTFLGRNIFSPSTFSWTTSIPRSLKLNT